MKFQLLFIFCVAAVSPTVAIQDIIIDELKTIIPNATRVFEVIEIGIKAVKGKNLFKLKKILPIAIKKQIYFSLIHSNIIYLNAIWGNTHMYLVKSIEMLQNRALKSVFDLPNIMPSITMYQTVKILNFRNMKFKNLCIFLYKLNNKLIKSNVDIKLNKEVHNYSTRSANRFHVDPYQTNFGKFGVLREAVHCFNTLEPNIQHSPNLDFF